MSGDTLTDGKRIGQLLSSEIHGHERGVVGRLAVVDADADIEPTEGGSFAFAIAVDDSGSETTGDGEGDSESGTAGGKSENTARNDGRIAEAYVHPDRLRVEFLAGADVAAEVGKEGGLRTRPKAVDPPRTIVFVESGAEVKPALRVVRAVAEERRDDAR